VRFRNPVPAWRERLSLALLSKLPPDRRDALLAKLLAEMPPQSRQRLIAHSPGFVPFAQEFLLAAGRPRRRA
jgi:hypothetical protein